METYEEFDYEQYEWIYYFFDGFDVTSFNNNLSRINGNNKLNNQPTILNLITKNKKKIEKKENEMNIKSKEKDKNIKPKKNNIEINIKNNNNNNLLLNSNSSLNSLPRNNGEISFAPITSNQFSSKESALDRSIKRSENSFKQSIENSSYKYTNTISDEDKDNKNNYINTDIKNNKNDMVRNIDNYLYDNNINDNDDNKLNQEDLEFVKNFVAELFEKKNNIFEYNPSSIGNSNVNDNFDNKEDEEFVKNFVSGFEKRNNEYNHNFDKNENNKDKINSNNIENNDNKEFNKNNIQNNKPKNLNMTIKNTNEDNINETKYSIPFESNPMNLNNTDENNTINNQENISSKNNNTDKNYNYYNKDSITNSLDNYRTFGNNELQTQNEYTENNVTENSNKNNNISNENKLKITQNENNKETNNKNNNNSKSNIKIINHEEENEINNCDKEYREDEDEIKYPLNIKNKVIINQKHEDNKKNNINNYNNEITESEFNHIDSHSTQKNEIDSYNVNNSNLVPNIKPDDKLSSIESDLNNKEKDNFLISQNENINSLNNKEIRNKQITENINKNIVNNKINNKNEIKPDIKDNKIINQIKNNNKNDNGNDIKVNQDINKTYNKKIIDNSNPNKDNQNIITQSKNKEKKINNIEIPERTESINDFNNCKNFQSKYNEFNNDSKRNENEYNKNNILNENKSDINFSRNKINDNNEKISNIRNIYKNNIYDKENILNNNSNFIINSNNILIPEKDNNNIIDSQPFDYKLNEFNSVNKKPENNNIDLKIPLMDYNIKSNTIIDFNIPYKTENNINNKVDFSEFDNTQYDNILNKKLNKKSDLFPTNNISSNSINHSKIKQKIKYSDNKLIPKSFSNKNFTNNQTKSNKIPYTIKKNLFQSIKNSKPELINDEKTPQSYLNQSKNYSKISDELRYSSPESDIISDKNKMIFSFNNFDYPKNKNRKNNLSMIFSKRNKLQLQGNDLNLDFKINELNNNLNISNNNLINKIPGINIDKFNENRKKNKEKFINEINLIKSPKIENPTPYQNTNEGNEKILKEIEELNQEILKMKNNENKNDFKDRLEIIKSEGFDKILLPTKKINHSTDFENKNMKISRSNIDLKVHKYYNDYQLYNDYIDDNNSSNLTKKLSPLGLIYPDKPRNSNNIIKRLKFKKEFDNEMDNSSYINNRSLLRNRKIINYKDDNDILKLRNIRLFNFKPNIDNDTIDDINNLKKIGSNIIFPINEIPFDMQSPFNKLYIKVPEDYENINNEENLFQSDILNEEVNFQNDYEDNQIQEK